VQAHSIDDKQLEFHILGQLMKRIIRSNAVNTSNEVSNSGNEGYLDQSRMSDVSIYSGAVIAVPTKEVNASVPGGSVNSVSLQTILSRRPSVVPCLVVLGSIAFLVISSIWAMNTRVEEASLFFELAPLNVREKALNAVNHKIYSVDSHTAIKVIPKEFKTTEAHKNYQTKQPTKVRFIHTYRVADMFFEE
jgi:hypothetical protein